MGIPEQVSDPVAFGQCQERVVVRPLPAGRDVVSEHGQGNAL